MFEREWYAVNWVRVAIVLVGLLPLKAFAQVHFNLPAEPLAQALKEIATETNLNVYFDPSTVAGIQTRALRADLTPKEAFARELAGTNLSAIYVDADTVRVVSKEKTPTKLDMNPNRQKQRPSAKQTPVDPPKQSDETVSGSSASSSNAELTNTTETLSTIVVTAQKYKQFVYDVPISLVVLDASQLENNGVSNLETLQNAVPGLTVESNGAQRRIAIEGVGDIAGNGGQVAEYINNADVTASPSLFGYNSLDIGTYDLKRVEVLRGPQGTVYGEGAEAGAIHFVTNKPELNRYGFGLSGNWLFTKNGSPSQNIFPVFNVPLVRNHLGIRIAGQYGHEGGWIDQPAAHQKNINYTDISDTRINLLWRPFDNFSLNLMQIIHRNSFGPNIGSDANENFTQVLGSTTTPRGQDQYNISNITAAYHIPTIARIINSATYVNSRVTINNYSESYRVSASGPLFEDIYLPLRSFYSHFSDEFRITNAGESSWRLSIGAFYKHVNASEGDNGYELCSGVSGDVVTGDKLSDFESNPSIACFLLATSIRSMATSEFMDIKKKVSRRITLGAGARNFYNSQRETNPGVPMQRATFTSVDPRIYAIYRLSRNINVYANASKGFRSGGFNSVSTLPPFSPEVVWRYEVGAKTRALSWISASADVYYSTYDRYQAEIITPKGLSETANAGNVDIKGIEGSLLWKPLEGRLKGLKVSVSGEYVDARFATISAAEAAYAPGDPVDFVPRYQFHGAVERDFTVDKKHAYLQVNYSQTARDFNRNRIIGPTFYGSSDNRYLLGLSLGIHWSRHMLVGLMARNLLDDRGYVDPDPQFGLAARNRPLTAGFFFSYKQN